MLLFGSRTSSLLSVLALCLTSQQVMGCNLCADGSDPTTPSEVIPGLVLTCEQYAEALVTIEDGTVDCVDAHLLGTTYCGCAVAVDENACSPCFDGSDPVGIEDRFVPGDDGDYPDPTPCTDFADIIPFEKEGSVTCTDYQLTTSAFCGCPPHPDACSLCPGNGTPSNPDGEVTDPETGITFTCSDLTLFSPSIPASDTECAVVQTVGQSVCGCPPVVDEFVCSVCVGNGIPSTPDAVVTFANGDVSTCSELLVTLPTSGLSIQECTSVIAVSSDACGCPSEETQCPLCGEGNALPRFPERILPEDQESGVSLNCAEAHALSASVPPETCPLFQSFAGQICGCPKDTDPPTVSPEVAITVAPTTQAPTVAPSTSGSESMMIMAGKSVVNFATIFLMGGLYFW
eukprot:scaffold47446_cov58-Attheya_sp.AAC.3